MLDVFNYTDEDFSLPQADETLTIAAAKLGDEGATLRLLRAYGPALRAAVSRFKSGVVDGQTSGAHSADGTPSRSIEDLHGAALVAFMEVLTEHDPALNPRLAGRLVPRLNKHLADEATRSAAFAVPERTLSRFYGILREYDGDVSEATEHASDHGMSREVFLQILAAAQTDSVEAVTVSQDGTPYDVAASPVFTSSPVVDVEDRILVEVAFKAVDDEEERICRLAYGFTEYDPQPDAEIAHRTGLTRPTVQRKRAIALGKMRKKLGATGA